MVLRLYDTLSRRKKELSYSGDEVTIYACGITPYSPSHIGHARQAIAFDTLVRWLNFNDIPTKYVTNFTDISDTIIQAAADEGVEFTEISKRHIDSYMKSMAALNVLQADAYPRVTESIDSIIKMIEKLVRKGHAYIADDGVYFEIDTAPEKYGALTGQTLEMVRSGAGGGLTTLAWARGIPGTLHCGNSPRRMSLSGKVPLGPGDRGGTLSALQWCLISLGNR